jgi:DNA-directed RNA polymerase subunit E"
MGEKACKKCRRIVAGDICPICKDSELTSGWVGYIVVVDPSTSQIAKHLGVTLPGKYALRLSK